MLYHINIKKIYIKYEKIRKYNKIYKYTIDFIDNYISN